MKTFSVMSAPDKRLTMQAYELLHLHQRNQIESSSDLPAGTKERLLIQHRRLQLLMEALQADLLAE